jgi:hypothetical protein
VQYSTVQHRATHQQPLARENRYGSMHALPVTLIPAATDFGACGGSWLLLLGRSPPPFFFQSCVEKADYQCTMLLSHRAQTPADAALLLVSQACGMLCQRSHLPSREGLAY